MATDCSNPPPAAIWPNGARAAIAMTIDNMGEAADLNRGLWPKDQPIGQHFSVTEVLPKLMSILHKYDISATYFIESWNLAVYPDTINAIARAGHEVAWHAYQHEPWGTLDEAAERENLERSFDSLKNFARADGGRVDTYYGFRPPGGLIHRDRTIGLCHSHDLQYISTAGYDAALVPVGGGGDGSIVVLPFRWTMVDAYYYMPRFSGLRELKGQYSKEAQTEKVLIQSFLTQIDEVIQRGGYLSVLFHPFLNGTSERLEAVETVIKYLAEQRNAGRIWLARCRDIQAWVRRYPGIVSDELSLDESSW